MFIDYGLLQPEINSGRMYLGPGSAPMLAAAAAWDTLALELHSAAAEYAAIVSGLTGQGWQGPASVAMADAAAPYVTWLHATAGQAEQTATQAKAAAAAHQAAFAMTVPPPLIAANRSLFMSLVASNILGQNAPAIAATEAHYGEMWAQDTAAMNGYQSSSVGTTSTLPAFNPAPHTVSTAASPVSLTPAPTGHVAPPGPATATTSATATTPASTPAPDTATTAAPPTAAPTSALSALSALYPLMYPMSMATMPLSSILSQLVARGLGGAGMAAAGAAAGAAGVHALGTAAGGALGHGVALANLAGLGATAPPATAALGQAGSIVGLSVPQTWAATAPAAVNPAVLAGATAAAPAAGATSPFPYGMPWAGAGGRDVGTPAVSKPELLRPVLLPRTSIVG